MKTGYGIFPRCKLAVAHDDDLAWLELVAAESERRELVREVALQAGARRLIGGTPGAESAERLAPVILPRIAGHRRRQRGGSSVRW